jgi:hypothetical protein
MRVEEVDQIELHAGSIDSVLSCGTLSSSYPAVGSFVRVRVRLIRFFNGCMVGDQESGVRVFIWVCGACCFYDDCGGHCRCFCCYGGSFK